VHPGAELGQDWSVAAIDGVQSRSKDICNLTLVNKNRRLRFAHRQLGPVLDLLTLDRKTINQSVTRIIEPLNNLDELRSDGVKYSHVFLLCKASSMSLG
jgi:hypothetical protein